MKIKVLIKVLIVTLGIFFCHMGTKDIYAKFLVSSKQKPRYFLLTAQHDKVPLFTAQESYQKIMDIKLANEMPSEVTVSHHALNLNNTGNINFSWYQSGKSELIVLAVGKGGILKHKLPFIKEFTQYYDVIVFDYEWQNPAPLYKRIIRNSTPLGSYFEHNYKEIQTIVRHVRQQKKYDCIIGHGECYSGFMFVKAQALKKKHEQLFDKLVLDSPILSAKNAVKSLFKNPALCINPLDGESYALTKIVVGNRLCLALIDFFSCDYSIQPYFPKINIPVLFIRGIKDTMVSEDDFNIMWDAVHASKAAFITPYHHSNSFKRKNGRKEYLYIENLFIKNSLNDFITTVTR